MRVLSLLAVLSMLVVACGDSAGVTTTSPQVPATDIVDTTRGAAPETTAALPTTVAPATTTPEEDTVPDDPGTSLPPGLELNPVPTSKPLPPLDVEIGEIEPALLPVAERTVEDLAERLGADPASIEIVTAEFVVWPDSALGCPQPGMAYLQVLTDGVRILLVHDGLTYSYHGGGNRDVFLCEQPSKPVQGLAPGSGSGDS